MTKELYFVDTLLSVKYNKTLKTLPLRLYESIHESLVTNIALGFASCYICHSTLISSCIFHINWRLSNSYGMNECEFLTFEHSLIFNFEWFKHSS